MAPRGGLVFLLANVIGLIPIAFGINALLRPDSALSMFPLQPSIVPSAKSTIEALIYLYGVRDIFMGVAIQAAAFFGGPRSLGVMLLAGAGVAIADGFIIKAVLPGEGHEWNHWGYSPLLFLPGAFLMT